MQIKDERIKISGLSKVDEDSRILLVKMLNNYKRKYEYLSERFRELNVKIKKVGNSKFELLGKLDDNGKLYNAKAVSNNVIFAMDDVLTKLISGLRRR